MFSTINGPHSSGVVGDSQFASQSVASDSDTLGITHVANNLAISLRLTDLPHELLRVITKFVPENNRLALREVSEIFRSLIPSPEDEVIAKFKVTGLIPVGFERSEKVARAVVDLNGMNLELVDDQFKNNREIVLAAVRGNPISFMFCGPDLLGDREIVRFAMLGAGDLLQHADRVLKDDSEIVMAAIANQPTALGYASERLRNDKNFILNVLSSCGDAFQYISEELKQDTDVVKVALRQTPFIFERCAANVKNNVETALLAVSLAPSNIDHIGAELVTDPHFLESLEKINPALLQRLKTTLY